MGLAGSRLHTGRSACATLVEGAMEDGGDLGHFGVEVGVIAGED